MLTCSKCNKNLLRKICIFISIISVLMLLFTGCKSVDDNGMENSELVIATTTSINDSGLFDYLSPIIKENTGINIKVIAKEAEQAIKAGEAGEADVLFINDKTLEEKFVSDGYGLERIELPSNYFVVLGPETDPAGISGQNYTAAEAFKKIADNKSSFVSAGKDSVLYKKEQNIWSASSIKPEGDWYISTDQDDISSLIFMADEKGAYTLANRDTYLSIKDQLNIQIVMDTADDLNKQYTVIEVNPDKVKGVNKATADRFVGWITSQRAYKLINEYVK